MWRRGGRVPALVDEVLPKLVSILAAGEGPRLDQLLRSGQVNAVMQEGYARWRHPQIEAVYKQAGFFVKRSGWR